MIKLDLVELKNEKPYTAYNLKDGMHGIVVDVNQDSADVLFFNPKNIGDYALINVKLVDLNLAKEKLPVKLQEELLEKLDNIVKKTKNVIEPLKFKICDLVELLVEDEKYTKYGIHKGDRGVIALDDSVQNYIEVDFSGIDKNGNYYGDCISVKLEDLKKIN